MSDYQKRTIMQLREALARIAFPERGNVDSLSADPSKWPATIAYEALDGRMRNGKRLDEWEDLV